MGVDSSPIAQMISGPMLSGQISIIPKPECFGDFGEVPLLNHHLGEFPRRETSL